MELHALADSDWRPPEPDEVAQGWRWRHRVDVALDGPRSRVAVSVSAPKENHAALLGLDEALSSTWAGHHEQAGAGWLRPWWERLRVDPDPEVTHRALLAAFAERHGQPATTYRWDV